MVGLIQVLRVECRHLHVWEGKPLDSKLYLLIPNAGATYGQRKADPEQVSALLIKASSTRGRVATPSVFNVHFCHNKRS
jgi:hypothetical protein